MSSAHAIRLYSVSHISNVSHCLATIAKEFRNYFCVVRSSGVRGFCCVTRLSGAMVFECEYVKHCQALHVGRSYLIILLKSPIAISVVFMVLHRLNAHADDNSAGRDSNSIFQYLVLQHHVPISCFGVCKVAYVSAR